MKKRAKRVLAHAFLRQPVNYEALQPDTPTFFKSPRSTLSPLPDVVENLPA